MAGPIKISIVADAQAATRSVGDFSRSVSDGVGGAAADLERANRRVRDSSEETGRGLEGMGEKADASEARILGLKDTVDGAATIMQGPGKVGIAAYLQGWADLASGLANFVVPALMGMSKATITSGIATVRSTAASVASRAAQMAATAATTVWTGAQWLLNAALTANPIGLVILAIVALVAAIIIAWKRSETFRRIVTGAFHAVKGAASAAWNWVKANWPLLLAIITGPIGLAVRAVVKHWDTIKAKVRTVPKTIKDAFSNAKTLLTSAGRNVVTGLWDGIRGMGSWLRNKVNRFMLDNIPGPAKRALGIASPSRVMRRLARWVPQGVALGLDDGRSTVAAAAGRMAAATVPGLGSSSTSRSTSTTAAGTLRLIDGGLGDSAAGALIISLLRPEIRKRGGLQAVFSG